ncbi:MAG: phosphatase PAP2 family protein [Lacunisphaera sp.]
MASPDSRTSQPGWLRQCAARATFFWPVKMIGTTLGMTCFFIAYFWVLRHPSTAPFVMPLTVADHWIGFWPAALPLYLSLWLYVSLAPALLNSRRELFLLGTAALAMSVIGLGIFYFWPTTLRPEAVDWSHHPGFAFLKQVDASGNACPSLHVAFALLAAVWLGRILCQTGAGPLPRTLNWLWCFGIFYSTVATGQHVALDVLAGAVLGSVIAFGSIRFAQNGA